MSAAATTTAAPTLAITAPATLTAYAASSVTVATTAALLAIAAREQHRAHAGNRLGPGLGQQGRGRFPGALAAAGHPGRDQPGHDGGREGGPAPLRQAGERHLPGLGRDLVGVRTAADGVDEVLAWCVHIDPVPVIAEVRTATPVGRERPDGEHIRECARPGRPPAVVVARLCDAEDTLVRPKQLQPGFQGLRRDVLPGMARGRYVDDLEAEAEHRIEPLRDVRFPCAARVGEDVRDVDLRFWGHAPQDARDERPVSSVGQDRAVRLPRVGIAVDAGEPREGLRRTRHQPGIGLVDPHPGAAVPADRGIGSRRRIRRFRLRGGAGTQRLRGGQHVIRRRDSLAQFLVDEAEKIEHVGVLNAPFVTVVIVTGVLMTPRVQAEEHDVPDHSYYLDYRDTVVVVLEYVQHPSWLAGVHRTLGSPLHPAYLAEILFAGENVIPVVHEGNATGVQVAVILGLVGFAADVDSALAERVDDNGGLSAGPILKLAVPENFFCHCALPKLI